MMNANPISWLADRLSGHTWCSAAIRIVVERILVAPFRYAPALRSSWKYRRVSISMMNM
jgi:hypothetical protein